MSPVLIFGAAGFLGKQVLRRLRDRYDGMVLGLDLPGRKIEGDREEIDILDVMALKSMISRLQPRAVVNCAGLLASSEPQELFRVNAIGSYNILSAIESKGRSKCRILFVGSAAEYGIVGKRDLPIREEYPINPVSTYGISKAAQTFFARAASVQGMDIVIARIFNLIGPELSPHLSLSNFARQVARIEQGQRNIIETGYLGSRRDYIDVVQAAEALNFLLENGSPGEEYNICSGFSWSMRDLLTTLAGMIPKQVEIKENIKVPVALDIPDIFGSVEKLRALGFNVVSTDMRQELRQLLDYWRSEYCGTPKD